jgi:hypothetical protein
MKLRSMLLGTTAHRAIAIATIAHAREQDPRVLFILGRTLGLIRYK